MRYLCESEAYCACATANVKNGRVVIRLIIKIGIMLDSQPDQRYLNFTPVAHYADKDLRSLGVDWVSV